MYEAFYGLQERPFGLTPNPRYLLLTPRHREAYANVVYGLTSERGITVLVGEAGTGKTTLIRAAIAAVDAETDQPPVVWAYLKNPVLSRVEFMQFLTARFGFAKEVSQSKTYLLDELEKMFAAGTRAALVVDEAQSVPLDLLEEIRLLANVESDTKKLLPIVLAGQPQLAARLNQPELLQLKQRVALRCALTPLSMSETATYIAGRIQIAGGVPGALFSRDAVVSIHARSKGIPRTINVICDNALLTGFVESQRPVGVRVIDAVCDDFDLLAENA